MALPCLLRCGSCLYAVSSFVFGEAKKKPSSEGERAVPGHGGVTALPVYRRFHGAFLMSYILKSMRKYCTNYLLSPASRAGLYLHTPLFKLHSLTLWAQQPARDRASALYNRFQDYFYAHSVQGADGNRYRLRMPFATHDLASYIEILWDRAYEPSFDVSEARSLVDLGANCGHASLYFLLKCPHLEKAVLVEANPQMMPVIKRTLRPFSSRRNVTMLNRCIAPKSGETVSFFVSSSHNFSSRVPPASVSDNQEVSVATISVRDLLDDHALPQADILKCDIEGSEYEVAAADPTVFTRFNHLFFELHGTKEMRDDFCAVIASQGFEIATRAQDETAPVEVMMATKRRS